MKSLLMRAVSAAGFEIRRKQTPKAMQALEMLYELRANSQRLEVEFFRYALANMSASHSQIFQDLFVLFRSTQKRGGYFVEFGACDGEFLSNTALLEHSYGWRGILSEPARRWHAKLKQNRNCEIDLRCVWSETGKSITFSESPLAELSAISAFRDHAEAAQEYTVETISLIDLLRQHDAPHEIDYLSIDTEGSELEILKAFDFSKYKFNIIMIEHNYGRDREHIFQLLINNGYSRVLEEISMVDDWYVRS
jgi:FkbM family methyltransferase